MSDVYQVRVEFDPNKFQPEYQRIGKAEAVIAALKRALNTMHGELRIAERELRMSREAGSR